MLSSKEIKILLGSPVINMELTEDQIKLNIKLSESQTKDFIKIFKCEDIKNYILDKLILINCKKTLACVLNKYDGILPDGLKITSHNYNSAKEEEHSLIDLLKEHRSREALSKFGVTV